MQGLSRHWPQPIYQGRVPAHGLLTFCRYSREKRKRKDKGADG